MFSRDSTTEKIAWCAGVTNTLHSEVSMLHTILVCSSSNFPAFGLIDSLLDFSSIVRMMLSIQVFFFDWSETLVRISFRRRRKFWWILYMRLRTVISWSGCGSPEKQKLQNAIEVASTTSALRIYCFRLCSLNSLVRVVRLLSSVISQYSSQSLLFPIPFRKS
jgi:hypothetical protein